MTTDDFGFEDFDMPDETPSQEATPTQAPEPIPQTVSMEEFNQMQDRLQRAEQFQQALKGIVSPEQRQAADPNQFLNQFVQNPQDVLTQQVQVSAQEIVQQEIKKMQVEQYFAQNYADLEPYKANVRDIAISAYESASRSGKPITEFQAIDHAVKEVEKLNLQWAQTRQQRQQGEEFKKNSIPFTVGSNSQPQAPTGNVNPLQWSNAEFAAWKRENGL